MPKLQLDPIPAELIPELQVHIDVIQAAQAKFKADRIAERVKAQADREAAKQKAKDELVARRATRGPRRDQGIPFVVDRTLEDMFVAAPGEKTSKDQFHAAVITWAQENGLRITKAWSPAKCFWALDRARYKIEGDFILGIRNKLLPTYDFNVQGAESGRFSGTEENVAAVSKQ